MLALAATVSASYDGLIIILVLLFRTCGKTYVIQSEVRLLS